jgi:hypothetical protein
MVEMTIDGVSGIVEQTQGFGIAAYPNPSSDRFFLEITTSSSETINVELYNSQGQVVKQFAQTVTAGKNVIRIDTEAFAVGQYEVKVKTKNQQQRVGVVVK